ncbi:MAG: hypothetical protein CVU46_09475, partial [Chloroflexi bacterium HGW-Chloroflexi-8]
FQFEELAKLFIQNKDGLVDASKEAAAAILSTSDSYKEYNYAMTQVGLGQQMLTIQEWDARQAQFATAAAVATTSEEYQKYLQVCEELGQVPVDEKLWAQEAALNALKPAAEGLKSSYDGLIQKQKDLNSAMVSWTTEAASKAVQGLSGLKVTGERYLEGLSAIDKVMGTNYRSQQDLTNGMQSLGDEYRKTGDLKTFEAGLEELKQKGLMPFQEELKTATLKAQELYDKLMALPNEIKIHVGFTSDPVPNPGGDSGGSKKKSGRPGKTAITQANGGDWLVKEPTWFLAGEAGWERATFEPVGKGSRSSSGETPPIQFIIGSVRKDGDVFKLAQQVAEVIRRERL